MATATQLSKAAKAVTLVALASAGAAFAACAGADGNQNIGTTPYASGSAGAYNQPPPGNGYPAAPPGYPAPYGTAPPGYAQQPAPSMPGASPAPSGAQTPLGPIVTTDPNQLQAMFAQAAQAAQAFLQPPSSGGSAQPGAPAPGPQAGPAAGPGGGGAFPGGMPTDLTDAGIRVVALMQAKGMQPEGNQAKGQLTEGGHLEFMVPMQAGKCYTIIGFSPPGQVRNLDLNLLAPPFYNFLAGQDTSDDNTPVIGKAPNPMCPVVPVPLNYKVDIVARAGSGQVGVQLFSRPK